MICPTCRAEYVAGVETCADCDVLLVHELVPGTAESDQVDWVKLVEVTDQFEAELIHGFLESEGVPCTLESLVFNAEPFTFGPLSKVRIHVPAESVDQARTLLRDREAPAAATEPVIASE